MEKHILQIFVLTAALFMATSILAASDKAQVQQAYHAWIKAMTTAKGDPQVVLKLYAPNAVLLATLSDKMKYNREGQFLDYFEKITDKKDFSVKTQLLVTQLFGNIAVNSGFYTFSFMKDGHETTLPARFNFVYQKENGKWLIVNHHSSLLPTK